MLMGTWRARMGMASLAAGAIMAVVLSGCGSGKTESTGASRPAPDASRGGSLSSVAPNTFLTFEGRRYRLVALEQADLVDAADFAKAGQATEADIDQSDLSVWRRQGDDAAVYTYAASPSEEPMTGSGSAPAEPAGPPAFWYRWVAP